MNFSLRLVTTTLLVAVPMAYGSDIIPGARQTSPIALVGATIHPVDAKPIEDGVLLLDAGKITAVGPADKVKLPQQIQSIDATGKHIYPGLFDAYTNLGLVEINAVRATRDYAESGSLNPNVKAQVAVNPDSELIPITRSNGVLLSLTAPTGGLISGRSAVMQWDGWTFEDLTLLPDAGLHLQWPNMSPAVSWHEDKSSDEQNKQRDKQLEMLDEVFDDARAYRQARASNPEDQPRDTRLESLLPVLDRKIPLIVRAEKAQQIQAAVAFALRQNLRLIILGGYDAADCATLLKKHNVPVIIASVQRLPWRRDDDYDAPFTLAARLHEQGVDFCISSSGRFGASMVRNLPYHAAMAAAFGLDRDAALEAITLAPARILGVADRVGSLTVGKDATLIITDGDPLETDTQVEAAYVQGRRLDLTDKHKQLWRKYQQKYKQLDAVR